MKKTWMALGALASMVTAAPLAAQAGDLPGAGLTEAPLRAVGGRLLVTARTADGHEAEFVLGTGNSVTVLTESTAAHLTGEMSAFLGDAPIALDDAHVVPDADLGVEGADPVGIIGANTLSAYDMLVDLPGGRLVLKEIGPRVEWSGIALSDPVRLRVYHGVVLGLDVEVNGAPYMAALDLGMPFLLVNDALVERAGLEERDSVTLGIGHSTFSEIPTVADDHPMFARWDPNGDGFAYVGAAIATDCAISVSWVHQELRTCAR